jgi:hypothetical protein
VVEDINCELRSIEAPASDVMRVNRLWSCYSLWSALVAAERCAFASMPGRAILRQRCLETNTLMYEAPSQCIETIESLIPGCGL